MAEITDIGIEDWSTTPSENDPADSERVGRNLPKQWRNKKSVFRGLSLEKEWVRFGKQTVSPSSSLSGYGSWSFLGSAGDLTEHFPVGRKVRLRDVAGIEETVYGIVWDSSHSGATFVFMSYVSGELVTSATYWVDLGAPAPTADGLPLFTESGTITISDANTTGAITFAHKQPDIDYFLKTTVATTTSAVSGAAAVIGTAKTQTGATITLHDAPTAGFNTVIGWWLLRELR